MVANIIYLKFRLGVSDMNVTDVRVRKLLAEGKMKAIVSVTLDNAFVIHDVKVVDGQNGLFVAMPSRKTPNGEFRDIAHPISQEARDLIQSRVLEKYQEALTMNDFEALKNNPDFILDAPLRNPVLMEDKEEEAQPSILETVKTDIN